MKKQLTRAARIAAVGVLLACGQNPGALADDNDRDDALALRGIMQDLNRDMQAIVDGMAREDWERVASFADRVAEHPRPPLVEKIRILGFVGSDAGRFRDHDGAVHNSAVALADAARSGDGPGVIDAFARLQKGCLACHRRFREAFVNHFYGEQ